MKNFSKVLIVTIFVAFVAFGLFKPTFIFAATTPSLWEAASFGVLSSTYTNIAAGTINGDLGYTTPPVTPTTVNGIIVSPKPPQAGLDQATALASLNGEWCTFTFPAGAIDLATDTTHGATGVYVPGVYCTAASSAASIGTSWIIFSGAGTYIFRIDGALTTVVNSSVTLTNGASSCDVFWTPIATTLGANSTFVGTVIDNASITVGSTVSWIWRALNYATTVTTNNATITVPVCGWTTPTLRIIKSVINDGWWSAISSMFNLYVQRFGFNVIWSPASGTIVGTLYTLSPGTYVVSEDINSSYTQSFAGDCNISGSVTLLPGDIKTCTITNNDITVPSGGGWGGSSLSIDNCPNWDYSPSYYDKICGTAPIVTTGTVIKTGTIIRTGTVVSTGSIVVTGTVIQTGTVIRNGAVVSGVVMITPSFPKTWLSPEKNISWLMIIFSSLFVLATTSLIVVLRKRTI